MSVSLVAMVFVSLSVLPHQSLREMLLGGHHVLELLRLIVLGDLIHLQAELVGGVLVGGDLVVELFVPFSDLVAPLLEQQVVQWESWRQKDCRKRQK